MNQKTGGSRQSSQRVSTSKRKQDTLDYGVVFPVLLQFPVVAKFLCNRGLADRIFRFDDPERPCKLSLVREPGNRYDPRAIQIRAMQADGHTRQPTTQTEVTDGRDVTSTAADDIVELTLGYVPKDIAYSLSQIVDNSHVFDIMAVEYFQPKNQITVKFGLQKNVLRDQRSGLQNCDLYYVKYFPHMPHHLKTCLYHINTMNLNKKEWLSAKEVQINEQQALDFDENSQSYSQNSKASKVASPEIDPETNKYNRNVLLVLDCVMNGMPNLFTEDEIKIHEKYKSVDTLAQTVFARMITRKRNWYIVDDHLSTYAPERVVDEQKVRDLDELQEAMAQLTQCGLLQTEQSVFDSLIEQATTTIESVNLESLAALLESLTMQQLTDLAKLANKAIRKVSISQELDVQEVTTNPLYSFHQYLSATVDTNQETNELLINLFSKSRKLSSRYSSMFVQYMKTHEKQYKRDLNRRAVVHKILSRVLGMIKFDESHYKDQSGESGGGKHQTTLLNFFKFKQTQTQVVASDNQQTTFEQRKQRRATKSFEELASGLRAIVCPSASPKRIVLVKMDPQAKALVTRCANLFFFYQLGDENAFQRLQLHDYGFYQYEQFQNYLTFREQETKSAGQSQTIKRVSDILPHEHPYLKPLFKTQADLLIYDCLLYLRTVTLPWLIDLKLKDCPHLLGYIGAKLTKVLLKHFCAEDIVELETIKSEGLVDLKIAKGSNAIRQRLFQSLEMLTDASNFACFQQSQGVIKFTQVGGHITYGTRKSDIDRQTVHFGRKYGRAHMMAVVLGKIAEVCLEKDKQYELSCLVYAQLLLGRHVKTHKRGDWWVRLCVDLKHLRLRKDSLKIANASLFDSQWVKTGPKNQILKMKQALEKTLKPQTKPTKIKQPKPRKPRTRKKGKTNEPEESKEESEKYNLEELEKDLLNALESNEEEKSQTSLVANQEPIAENFKKVFLSCIRVDSAPPRLVLDANGNYVPDRVVQSAMYFDPHNNEYFDVENLALRYYSKHERLNGMHCENSLGKQFFGILMWEVVFYDKVPYVFQSPFQALPLDFGTKDFYLQRVEIIVKRLEQLAEMSTEQLAEEITCNYNKHKNKYNSLVNWDSTRLTLKRLVEIGSILGGQRLSKILENYCKDFKYWAHGMPDLILWSQTQNKSKEETNQNTETKVVKFSEVKSESDRLSEVQIAWLNFFSANDILAEVCLINRVEEGGQLIEVFPG